MNYFGQKSLSSLINKLLTVIWYIMIVITVVTPVIFTIMLFCKPLSNPEFMKYSQDLGWYNNLDLADKMPLIVKMICIPYFLVIIAFALLIIRKAKKLFKNFEERIVFDKNNVLIISSINKIFIAISILTFNFSALIICLFLFIVIGIFKHGAELQEEHDLTI